MKRKLLAVLITAVFAAPAAYAQGTAAPKDSGGTKAPAASGSTSTKGSASVGADAKAGGTSASAKGDASAKADTKAKDGKSPDAMITGKVKTGFIKDKIVRSRNYNVDTKDGVVTVKGKARTQAELDRALEIAKKTEGVKDVKNEVQLMASADASSKAGGSATGASGSSKSGASASSSSRPDAKKDASASTTTKGSATTTTK